MRKYLICLALATFAFTVGIILFNGQTAQTPNRKLVSTPNLRTGNPTDSTMQQAISDSDDSGIIEGKTLDDNSSDEGAANPYEPVVADPSGWSDGSADPVPETAPIVEESAGTPETEAEHIIEEGPTIPIAGPEDPAPVIEENNPNIPIVEENNPASFPIIEENNPVDSSDSDSDVTPGVVIESPAPSAGSDSDDTGRGVIEIQPIDEPEIRDPYGETEVQDPAGEGVTEGEVLEVALPTPSVNGGEEGTPGVIEVSEPVIISEPVTPEPVIADPVIENGVTEGEVLEVALPTPSVNGGDEGTPGVIEVSEPVTTSEPVTPEPVIADPEGGVTEGEVLEVALPTPSVNGGEESTSGVIEVTEPVTISEPAPTPETEVVDPAVPESTD